MGLSDLLGRSNLEKATDYEVESTDHTVETIEQDAPLLKLPTEILHQILENLECQSLISLARVCRQLQVFARDDNLWSNLLRHNIPENDFPREPFPSSSYRDLYVNHHPYWFVPRYKIWISDEPHVGRVMICRFDPRRGVIEGYRLLADRGDTHTLTWHYKPSVMIHTFLPRVHLWLNDPLLSLPHNVIPFNTKQGWWEGEIKMSVGYSGHNVLASFFLSRNIPPEYQSKSMSLWPPRTIPNMPRVRAMSEKKFRDKAHKPQKYSDISNTTFRLRHWSQFGSGSSVFGVRIGEEVSTWSTIDPSLYTPTKDKPYQGIFVGDYAGHGCEFLLVMHTEKAPPPPPRERPSVYMRGMFNLEGELISDEGDESNDESAQSSTFQKELMPEGSAARDDESIYHGALEAVKLTGDANIPRGEHTWIADDISKTGLIRFATEHPFRGARIVKGRGHVAATGFINDEFIPSQLIMMNHNQLAQYWVPFGHISFYQRIDIDEVMNRSFGSTLSGN